LVVGDPTLSGERASQLAMDAFVEELRAIFTERSIARRERLTTAQATAALKDVSAATTRSRR
jgi:RNase H-fold protein (predicted Holliday junction resolvase)